MVNLEGCFCNIHTVRQMLITRKNETEPLRQIQASRVSVRLCKKKKMIEFTAVFRTELERPTYKKSSAKCGKPINPLKPELNPICYLLALLAHHFLHVSRIRIKLLTFRLLMSYIYGAPILDVPRSHTTTQHSR